MLLSVVLPAAFGQVVDTSRNINTWQLMHNYTRFEEVPLDTNMHQLHRDYHPAFKQGFSYEYLGTLGHGINHVDFMLRPDPDVFLFGRAWNPYLKTADRTLFFNTKTPFTSLSYSTIPVKDWREENISILHTQNASAYTNFGIDFNILAAEPLYLNSKTRVNRVGLFGSHVKEKYSLFTTFYYNDFNADDNGGLLDLDAFLDGTEDDWFKYSMNLGSAHSHYRNLSLFATQKFNLVERSTSTDSLGNTTTSGKTLSIAHQLLVERQLKEYTDEVSLGYLSPIYDNYYYLAAGAQDSVSEDKISNVLQLILGDPDYDKISARVSAGYEFRRFGMLSPEEDTYLSRVDTITTVPLDLDSIFLDTIVPGFNSEIFNDLFVGFHLAGPTTGVWDWVVNGTYYFAGYKQHDFAIHSTFSRELAAKTKLGIRGSFERTRPHYFTNYYSSSFFQWDNDFSSMLRVKGEAFIRNLENDTDIRLGAAYISNYIYWNQDALPVEYDQDLLLLSGYFSKHFKVSGFNSENKVLLQYTTANEVLRLPLAALYSSNYWKQSLFKGALIADLGFDLYYTTRYRANSYMPATGIFYLQDDNELGGYPFLDVFLAFRVQRTRMFVSYNNIFQSMQFTGNNFFTTNHYPLKPRHFRIGLVWTFYD